MNRRTFLNSVAASLPSLLSSRTEARATNHVIFIINGGGARKKDYFENPLLGTHVRRMASEGFVFTEDHSERIAFHDQAVAELMQGRPWTADSSAYPTILDYERASCIAETIEAVPGIMERERPRLLVCRETAHDRGHDNYDAYLQTVKATDGKIGTTLAWVRNHSYFSGKTAIIVRPEFGRDDEVNADGHLHHSFGFYYTHCVASIFWGPDFNRGTSRTPVRNIDMTPTIARILRVDAKYAKGRVMPGLLKRAAGSRTPIAFG